MSTKCQMSMGLMTSNQSRGCLALQNQVISLDIPGDDSAHTAAMFAAVDANLQLFCSLASLAGLYTLHRPC